MSLIYGYLAPEGGCLLVLDLQVAGVKGYYLGLLDLPGFRLKFALDVRRQLGPGPRIDAKLCDRVVIVLTTSNCPKK